MRKTNYTLIEILVVLAIVAILSGISLGVYSYVGNKNKETRTQVAIKLISLALENYKREFGAYPYPQTTRTYLDFRLPASSSASAAAKKDSLWGCFKDVQLDSSGAPTGIKGLKLQKDGSFWYVIDAWDNRIIYLYPGKYNQIGYDLGSKGPDKKYGDNSESDDDFGKADDLTNFKR